MNPTVSGNAVPVVVDGQTGQTVARFAEAGFPSPGAFIAAAPSSNNDNNRIVGVYAAAGLEEVYGFEFTKQ